MSGFNWKTTQARAFVASGSIVLFGIVVLALIIYGVRNHEETGLMGACFSNGLMTKYELYGPEDCPSVEWLGDIPIRFHVADYAEVTEPNRVDSSVSSLNSEIGFELFRRVETTSTVEVVFGVAGNTDGKTTFSGLGHRGADARHFIDPKGNMGAIIRLSNVGVEQLALRNLMHELLHVAGLGHDDFESSIMYEGLLAKPGRVTDSDKKLLRKLYERRFR